MRHVFSIDIEDWYQGIELPMNCWHQYKSRIEIGTGLLLDLMDEYNVKATCFVLGKVAEDHPDLVKKIHSHGHEIATHGYSHEKIYNLTPDQFRKELRHSIQLLQDITGEEIIGHRAPYFTITKQSLWALDILLEEGIKFDSSIHPVFNWRYGIADADRTHTFLETPKGRKILEVPVSTFPVPKMNIPVGGGAYLRIYPYWLQRYFLNRLSNKGETLGIYVHPWEMDPDHPKIDLPFKVSATHYFNLKSTNRKLERLFCDFTFRPYREVFDGQLSELTV